MFSPSQQKTPQKRRFEEFQDPDYPQPLATSSTDASVTDAAAEASIKRPKLSQPEREAKISAIIKREFQAEMARKDAELQRVEYKLQQSRRLLQRIRYAIVYNFYTKKRLEYSEQEQQNELLAAAAAIAATDGSPLLQTQPISEQKPIHPSLKKLLGKKPIDLNELLKIRPARQAAESAKSSIKERLVRKKNTKLPLNTVTAAAETTTANEVSVSVLKKKIPCDYTNIFGRNYRDMWNRIKAIKKSKN